MGRFTLRLPESLHQELETQALQEGVSLNQYIVYALTRQISSGYTVQVTPAELVKEQRAQYQALLDRLGEPSEAETDAILEDRAQADEPLPNELLSTVRAKFSKKEDR